MNTAVRSIIEAFDSRIITGLDNLYNMRKRLTVRNKLASSENPQLPVMIPLFGLLEDEKSTNEVDQNNDENNNSLENIEIWIENVEGTNFEIHYNREVPFSFDVIICSRKVTFWYSYNIEIIDENSFKVFCSF